MKLILLIFLMIGAAVGARCQSQQEMNETASKQYTQLDRELNSTYQQILTQYKTDTAFIRNFKACQKAWITLRDNEIKTMFPGAISDYGSILPMCWSNYMSLLTNERIKHLKIWIDGTKEGDVCSGSVKIIR